MVFRARRSLVGAVISMSVLVFLAAAPQPAAACSMAVPDGVTEEQLLRKDLRHAYAAIVGRLIEVRPAGPQVPTFGPDGFYSPRADFRYRIERVFKGKRGLRRGRVVTVRSISEESACGLPSRVGKRYGLLLHRRAGHPRWRAGLFDAVSPRKLRAAFRK